MHPRSSLSPRYETVEPPARRERDREVGRGGEREREKERRARKKARLEGSKRDDELDERQHHCIQCIRVGVFSDILTGRLPPPLSRPSKPTPRCRVRSRFVLSPSFLVFSLFLAPFSPSHSRSLPLRRSSFPSFSFARFTLFLFSSLSLAR